MNSLAMTPASGVHKGRLVLILALIIAGGIILAVCSQAMPAFAAPPPPPGSQLGTMNDAPTLVQRAAKAVGGTILVFIGIVGLILAGRGIMRAAGPKEGGGPMIAGGVALVALAAYGAQKTFGLFSGIFSGFMG